MKKYNNNNPKGAAMEDIKIMHPSMSDEIWVTQFDEDSAQMFRDKLLQQSKENPNKPIIVYIDSYGGQVDALAKMVATIDEVPNPIITAAYGKAMSCGAILLSHGDIRFCDPHARIMVHRVSAGTFGDVDEMKNDVAEVDRINKYWLGFLATNSNIKNGYNGLDAIMKQKDGRDRHLTATEAKKFGLIDVVGRPKVMPIQTYEVLNGPEKMSIQKRAKLRYEMDKSVVKEQPIRKKKISRKKKPTRSSK